MRPLARGQFHLCRDSNARADDDSCFLLLVHDGGDSMKRRHFKRERLHRLTTIIDCSASAVLRLDSALQCVAVRCCACMELEVAALTD